MKRSLFTAALLIVCILAASAGCTDRQAPAPAVTPLPATTAATDSDPTLAAFRAIPQAPLNASETEDVLYLQEAEKFDYDLNAAFFGMHGDIPVFLHIANVSRVYMTIDNVILERYGITPPEKETAGSFNNGALQQRYNTAVNTGLSSVTDALKSSADFEDMHIADLSNAMTRTDNADVQYIYRQELATAKNNLRELSVTLQGFGVTYVPKYITPGSYYQIISSPAEQLPVP